MKTSLSTKGRLVMPFIVITNRQLDLPVDLKTSQLNTLDITTTPFIVTSCVAPTGDNLSIGGDLIRWQ